MSKKIRKFWTFKMLGKENVIEILELKNIASEINLLDVVNSRLATRGKRINEPKERTLEVIQIESERRKKD